MNNIHSVYMIAVMSVVTIVIRVLPFVIFSGRETPKYITYLGQVLPSAIIGMLVVYCLEDISLLQTPYGVPELLACVFVVLLHIWKRNTLISIGSGTIFYMLLIQLVF